jgi:glycosyltransferase involved in cell wall biosynthesis
VRVSQPHVSIVIPCLNESATVGACVHIARDAVAQLDEHGEVIVVDNGSTDGSPDLAAAAGAQVLREPRRGYGQAYLTGLAAARGDHLVMGDADLTYDFNDTARFVAELEAGADLVIGNRMASIRPGAMPWLHQYVGNPLMTRLVQRLHHTDVGDVWCGMRALTRDAYETMGLTSTGMEFALQMIVRSTQRGLDVREIPIVLHPRGGESKLDKVRDGLRGLRLIVSSRDGRRGR